ncbi:hypothetical protein UG55_108223 [Frankia sp. EI5c]|uniref:hypothetical protein n=1 Tax=Frankia sp. EI5c TaxID=683316 RepID=UPI0007C2BD33|nr:hypothetical protein [Frankia sp. EI5c]OAA20024.1 hypothetical protein UG55_108223 [Frankia sp. EI5c]
MDQDESVDPTPGSVASLELEVVPAAPADGGELAESSAGELSFGSVANPNRLRLGVSRSL